MDFVFVALFVDLNWFGVAGRERLIAFIKRV